MAKFSSLLYTLFFIIYVSHVSHATINVYNVINFGAIPDGITDSTPAFLRVWFAACSASSDSSNIINVPKGSYSLGSLVFQGKCKSSDITFQINGTLVPPPDYRVLGPYWLSFEGVSGVTIFGGALDAKGKSLWACKAAGSDCPNGATTLGFTNSNNIRIESYCFREFRDGYIATTLEVNARITHITSKSLLQ